MGPWSTGGGPPAPRLASAADVQTNEEVPAPEPVRRVDPVAEPLAAAPLDSAAAERPEARAAGPPTADLSGRAREAALDYGTALYVDSNHPQAAKLGQLCKRAARSLSRSQQRRLAREPKTRGELLEEHPLATVLSSRFDDEDEGRVVVEDSVCFLRVVNGEPRYDRVEFDELGRRKRTSLVDIEQPERLAQEGRRLGLG